MPPDTFDPPPDLPLASRWQRLAGAIIDNIIAFIFSAVLFLATGDLFAIMANDPPPTPRLLAYVLAGFLFFLATNGWLLARRGQTIGKLIVGTRIVSFDTNHILPLAVIIPPRYMLFWGLAQLPGLGFVITLMDALYIFREDRRCLHDLVARTKVVTLHE